MTALRGADQNGHTPARPVGRRSGVGGAWCGLGLALLWAPMAAVIPLFPTRRGVEVKRIALSATEIDLVERARPGHVATATADGASHLFPKGTVRVLDGGARIGFAHIHSHRTIANLATNPALVFSVVDVFQRRGLLIYGNAKACRLTCRVRRGDPGRS